MTAIALEGVVNFRDFGGYLGADGRRVRPGRLFRSGHSAEATDADLESLAALDFALLVDLRRPPERARDIARRPDSPRARLIEHNGPTDLAFAPHLTFLTEPGATPDRVIQQMIVGYRGYPFDPHYVAVYRQVFAILADLDGPLLINCHAGKDRTGFLCALILHVLGVSDADIRADYLATNRHNRADARLEEMKTRFQATYGHPVSDALVLAMLSVEEVYLDAAYAAIAEAHGDVDTYLAEVVGLTPQGRLAIRDALLEPA